MEESDPQLKIFCKISGTGFTGTKTSNPFPQGGVINPPPQVTETFDASDKICACEFPRPDTWNKDELVQYCGSLGRDPVYTYAQELGKATFTKNKSDLFAKCSYSMEAYCLEYPDQCMSYCNKHALDPLMGKWCNDFVIKHCKEDQPDSKECLCVNSKISNAICRDPVCLENSTYKTNEMLKVDPEQQCPSYCEEIIRVNDVGRNVDISSNTFNIRCNLQSNKNPAFGLKTWYTCKNGQCVQVKGDEQGTSTNPECCSPEEQEKYRAWKLNNTVTAVSVSLTVLVIVVLVVYFF